MISLLLYYEEIKKKSRNEDVSFIFFPAHKSQISLPSFDTGTLISITFYSIFIIVLG